MAGYDGVGLDASALSGEMVFEPILEEGVFRFDCSVEDRNAAFPSISFENPKVRDTPMMNLDKPPTYIPTFECALGQQIVNIEVTAALSMCYEHHTSIRAIIEVLINLIELNCALI